MAHKLRLDIEDLNIPHLGSPITDHITISLGVACLCPRQISSEHKLIELADNALS